MSAPADARELSRHELRSLSRAELLAYNAGILAAERRLEGVITRLQQRLEEAERRADELEAVLEDRAAANTSAPGPEPEPEPEHLSPAVARAVDFLRDLLLTDDPHRFRPRLPAVEVFKAAEAAGIALDRSEAGRVKPGDALKAAKAHLGVESRKAIGRSWWWIPRPDEDFHDAI